MKLRYSLSLVVLLWSCSNERDRVLPLERTLTESVYASVIVQPDSLYQVYAIVSGLLEKTFFEEGDLVAKGQHIFQIINNTTILNAQNSEFALNLARQNYQGQATVIRSIENEINAASLNFKNDSINYFRQKKLWDQNIGSKAAYDLQKLNYELASNQLKLLKNKLNRAENELQTALKQAQNNYESAKIATEDFTIDSKINGKLYAIYKEPGEIVTSIEPLAAIGSATQFVVQLLVDEVDIVRIATEQLVYIHLDAYPNRTFEAKVSKIYPKKDERNQTFTVEALFVQPPEILYPGLSGEANIVIAQKEHVLTIPADYLFDANKVQTDEGLLSVETGLQNMEYIEIISGISKDTYIYKPN